MISTFDLGWIAGLLEGEGFFGLTQGKYLRIQVAMTDTDVIERLRLVLGFGYLDKTRRLPSGKIAYYWIVANQSQAAGLMMTLLPLMGQRRSEKIRECLVTWKKTPLRKALWTHCKNGHELSPENTRTIKEGKYLKRRCIRCAALRQAKYRLKNRMEADGHGPPS